MVNISLVLQTSCTLFSCNSRLYCPLSWSQMWIKASVSTNFTGSKRFVPPGTTGRGHTLLKLWKSILYFCYKLLLWTPPPLLCYCCSRTCSFSSSSWVSWKPCSSWTLCSLSAERKEAEVFLQTDVMQMSVCWRRLTSCLFVTLADGRKHSESLRGGGREGRSFLIVASLQSQSERPLTDVSC